MNREAIVIDKENMRIEWCDRSEIDICPLAAYLVGKYGTDIIDSKHHFKIKEDTLTKTFYFTIDFGNDLDFDDFCKFLDFYGYGPDNQKWELAKK